MIVDERGRNRFDCIKTFWEVSRPGGGDVRFEHKRVGGLSSAESVSFGYSSVIPGTRETSEGEPSHYSRLD